MRFNAFTEQPVPTSQAVMFCLMDVSGSMGEREKDLAKRFYMLLHLFLKRRYEKVDIVFIRHTHDAQEVDEQEFFYSRQSGGTIVSTALDKMLEIQKERYATADWNIYAAQASDGYTQSGDARRCVEMLNARDHAALPVLRLYRNPRRARDGSLRQRGFRRRIVARLSHRRRDLAQFRHQAHLEAGGHFPGVPRAVQEDGGAVMATDRWRRRDLLFHRIRMGFRGRSTASIRRSKRSRWANSKLDVYPNQIEVISSEQMLDAYSSLAMPLMYNHWSFGKLFAREEALYRGGYQRARL